jgi:vacuolar protein sorting-associated protein 13A/C
VTEEIPPTLTFTLDLEGIGLSLMNWKMLEVVYLSMNSLKFEYSSSLVAQAVNLSLGLLQIDNQLHDAIYPVLLQPTPIPKEASAVASPPTIQASAIWLNDEGESEPTAQTNKPLTRVVQPMVYCSSSTVRYCYKP